MTQTKQHSTFAIAALLLLALLARAAIAQPECANPKALGTSRILSFGTQGGLAVGLKTYPQTLALEDHELVLTFDDGPLPATTTLVLDALAKECVRATFFLIGRNAAAAPALVKREIADGHTVAHHTFSHPGVTLRNYTQAKGEADIERGFAADDAAAYGDATNAPRVPFFRFPGFADTTPLLRWLDSRDIAVFGADIWASDWEPMTPAEELDKLMARVEKAGRGIVLMHDIKTQTAAMLPAFLRALKKSGYRVVHIEPGIGKAQTRLAPDRWTSETDRALERLGYVERPDDAPLPLAQRKLPLKGPL